VDLYFIRARQRRLSLRFLTWYILKEDIQQETHDSIEDARSALLLYKAYQKFEEEHIFDEKLEELYRVGKEYVCHSWPYTGAGTNHKYGIELEAARCRAQANCSSRTNSRLPTVTYSQQLQLCGFIIIYHAWTCSAESFPGICDP
jgi:hypothetical protein